jgi:signal transduction histidine kinase
MTLRIGGRRIGTAARLGALQALVLAAVLSLAVIGLVRAFQAQATASTTRQVVAEMQAFSAAAAQRPATESLRSFTERYLRTAVLPEGEALVVTLADRSILGSAGSAALLQDPQVQAWAQQPPSGGTRVRSEVGDHATLLVAAPLRTATRTTGTIVVAADLTQTTTDTDRARNLAVGEALLALVAGTAGGYLLLRRLLRRIGGITATAAELGQGRLDRRLGDQGTDDEVAMLAATFDQMADRVSAAMEAQRRLLSDVSHQLRTPLTVARGHLEVLGRSGAADPAEVQTTVEVVIDELDHMRALVEHLLLLGRALEPDFLDRVPVDLRTFCLDLFSSARVLADRDWQLSSVPDVVVDVDEPKLRGAVLNLIDNAVRATATGDTIALSVLVEGRTLRIGVDDSGPGIPPDVRAQVVERFARPGAADSEGSGLGLAIVTAVAQAHGGSFALTDSVLGGLRCTMVLPDCVAAGPDGE